MPLPGVVPFPPEFAKRYREKGYWQHKSLAQEFDAVFKKYASRVALIDGGREYTYADIDRITDNLALNLLELGLKPLDRVVPALPNIAEFVLLYFALQKISGIPIAALVTHRFAEINQFVQLSGATTVVYPERQSDFDELLLLQGLGLLDLLQLRMRPDNTFEALPITLIGHEKLMHFVSLLL